MLTPTQKNAVMLAHDTHTMLTILAQKTQQGQELTEDDIKAFPTLMSYSGIILKQLLEGLTEEPVNEDPEKDQDVREGEVQDR